MGSVMKKVWEILVNQFFIDLFNSGLFETFNMLIFHFNFWKGYYLN